MFASVSYCRSFKMILLTATSTLTNSSHPAHATTHRRLLPSCTHTPLITPLILHIHTHTPLTNSSHHAHITHYHGLSPHTHPCIRNIAEAIISKGLAYCLRHRQDDDQRSSCYDELVSAEARAAKNSKGVHSKKEPPIHRVGDMSKDPAKAKQFLPFLQRAGRTVGLVEVCLYTRVGVGDARKLTQDGWPWAR